LALLVHAAPAGAAEAPKASQSECELGITLALLGRPAAAESVFTSLLSHAPGDPRALTNLGNVALLRGEPDLALAFYEQAQDADSTDAGIVLNQATALLLLGEEESASARAAEGVRRAGGAQAAAGLLGLRYRERKPEAPKAEQRAYVSKEEVLTLLRAAARKVPADSARAGAASGRPDTKEKKRPLWRSAGPRAGAAAEAAMLVYWKR
jgi:Flp pilus assembly protein TadD